MTTKPKKVVIKKKAILATPEIEFKTTKEKGDAYEIFIKHYLIDTGNYKSVYLWKDVPEADLFACGIMDDWNTARIRRKQARTTGILPDFGTDLLVKSSSGDKYSIVQCKHYDESRPLSANDLGTFLCMVMRYHKQVSSLVYSSSGFQNHLLMLEDNYNITYNELKFNPARYLELLNTIYKPDVDKENSKILIPYDYQLEAINALKGKDRTVCQLPCGCGKTLIAIKLCEAYKQNVIITPLKSYCEQNLDRFTSQMDGSYAMMIIDSDGDGRNIDKIQEFVKKNNKICLFVTFKSVDIINKLIGDGLLRTGEYYIVIDEFHNLSINDIHDDILEVEDDLEDFQELENVNLEVEEELDIEEEIDVEEFEDELEDDESIEDNNTEMYKLLHSNARILFMSATPRLYGDDIGYSEDCDIEEEIFGNIDYKMPMHEAIASGKICNYMVYVPTLSIEKTVGLDKIQEEVDIHGYDKELVIKARFLLRGMMNNGSKRCIIYLQTQEECRKMNTILTDIGKNYFGLDINSNYLISDLGREERKLVLKAFIDKEGYNFICSVDILNECIDIPECDSIFIAYPSKSKIRNIQRVCRANRKDKKNVDKVARIYVWADEYKNDLVDFIGHLKEYDESFTFEKIKRVNVNGKMNAVMRIDDDEKENTRLEGLVVGVKGINSWIEKLQFAETQIIQNNNKKGYRGSPDLIKATNWLNHQYNDYYHNRKSMKNKERRDIFEAFMEKYKVLFLSNTQKWHNKINIIRNFIKINNRRPIHIEKYALSKNELNVGKWIVGQVNNYNNKSYLMKNEEIYNSMTEFLAEFKQYFKKYLEIWIDNYNYVYERFKKQKTLVDDKDDIYLKYINKWFCMQKIIFNNTNNTKYDRNIRNNADIKKMWETLKITFPDKFKTHNDIWIENKLLLKEYINYNNQLPILSENNTEIEIRLIKYIDRQKQNIRLKRGLVIKKPYIDYWEEFCIQFPELKITYNEIKDENWKSILEEVIEHILTHENKRPSSESTNPREAFLGGWINTQNQNFKNKTFVLKNEELYNEYGAFLEKFEDIKIDSDLHWKYMLKKHKEYLLSDKKNNKFNNEFIKKLTNWYHTNHRNFKNKAFRMKDNEDGTENEYYLMYKEHKEEFYEQLLSNDERWWDTAESLEENYLKLGKKPLKNKLDKTEKRHAQWICTQHNNIKNNKESMIFPDRKEHWLNLREKYFELLLTENEDCINTLNKIMKFIDNNYYKPNKRKNGEEGQLGRSLENIKKSYKNKKGLIFEKEVLPTFNYLKQNYSNYITF